MNDLDAIFSNMEKASLSDKGVFFTSGIYENELLSFEYRNGYKGASFIAKFKVLASSNIDHPVDSTRTWILKLDNPKTKDQNMGDIKSLIFALLGKNPRDIGNHERNPEAHKQAVELFKCMVDEAYGKKVQGERKLATVPTLVGRRVALEAVEVVSEPTPQRPNGGKFTRMTWSPVKSS